MRDVIDELLTRTRAGETVALGTVVRTFHSAPRPPGAAMLVCADGTVAGSVSGGCVEGAVYERGQAALAGDLPHLQRYGVSDDDAFTIGLTCGGIIDIFTETVSAATFPELESLARAIDSHRPVALVTLIADSATGAADPDTQSIDLDRADESAELLADHSPAVPTAVRSGVVTGAEAESYGHRLGRHLLVTLDDTEGSLGSARLDEAVRDDVRGLLAAGRTGTLTYGPDGQRRGEGLVVFVASFAPRPRMLVFGAIDFAAAVARIGVFLGYRVTVCDARPVFATPQRFPDADEVVVAWPHRYLAEQIEAGEIDQRTVVCVLTHDPKFDVPVLQVALRTELGYVGAMGSRRTHLDRLDRLREAGMTEAELARLHSPIGLDLGARTPEETAVSIAAEIIALQWQGDGRPLSQREGPIHNDPVVAPGEPSSH